MTARKDRPSSQGARNGVALNGISKRYGDVWAVRDVNAVILPGETTAFIGPNGAGKTTLFHIIAGGLRPDAGEVVLNGRKITGFSAWRVARLGLGQQFQDVRVFRSMSSLENVLVALMGTSERSPVWAFRNCLGMGRFREEHSEQALRWLDFVGLSDKSTCLAGELSFGQQRLLSIARLLAKRFEFLLLDEPTAGLAPEMADQMVSLIRRLVEKEQITVALIEHNMSVVSGLASKTYFMHEGRIAFAGKTDQVLDHKGVRELYMGL